MPECVRAFSRLTKKEDICFLQGGVPTNRDSIHPTRVSMSPKSTNAADAPIPIASPLWWVVPAAALVVLPLIGMFFGDASHESVTPGTSYDASDDGFRGVYLILEELGYPVERSR